MTSSVNWFVAYQPWREKTPSPSASPIGCPMPLLATVSGQKGRKGERLLLLEGDGRDASGIALCAGEKEQDEGPEGGGENGEVANPGRPEHAAAATAVLAAGGVLGIFLEA
nr:unnamed protein product [Digitaria exilis]